MNIRDLACKNILKKKMRAENDADIMLGRVLENDEIRELYSESKKLIVDIAKTELDGKTAVDLKEQYNANRDKIANLLVSLGYSKQDLKPKYSCVRCKDTGVVAGKDCECLKKEISRLMAKLSGVDIANFPKFNEDYSCFEDEKSAKKIYELMFKFVKELDSVSKDNVLLVGDTGVGKTHLMQCMASLAIQKGYMVKYTTAFNFNQEMLKYHIANLDAKEDIINPYLKSDILFIDDLGSENKINSVTNEYLYLVLNERMLNHKKTVITTNLNLKQIQDSYGERIFSRLLHKKQSVKVNLGSVDLRTGLKENK